MIDWAEVIDWADKAGRMDMTAVTDWIDWYRLILKHH